ncbi:MAG: nucleoside kinase [Clostridium butyricum]|nr:nucleoside kinase [Clostridium butyricum]
MIEEKIEIDKIKSVKGIKFYDAILKEHKEIIDKVAICKLNGRYHELSEIIEEDGDISLVGFNNYFGIKIYSRTLQFIFIKAVLDIFPDSKITIEQSISQAIYGEIHKDKPLTEVEIIQIKKRMQELIDKNILINRIRVSKERAIEIFSQYKMNDKIKLIENCDLKELMLCELDGRYDYFYECMGYSTGIIKVFDIQKYEDGFILRRPDPEDMTSVASFVEQKSLSKVFLETERWLRILDVGEVGTLNEKVNGNELQNVIMVSEALHEKKIANIADEVLKRKNVKVILIAGPSSSGKTTFANRLSIQLRVNGLIPIPLSLDNYFVNRADTPVDENGEYDYESIEALDLKLLNKNLSDIMKGNEVEIPTYNFKTGSREWTGTTVQLPKNGVLIVEGIHGLNPKLISNTLSDCIYKIYISALTQLNIDNHNRISTTDSRKVRRIVRDSLSRGYGAEETLKMWPSIKRGEKKNIFVYQEEADSIFNSTLVYELGVLKPFALRELEKIPNESPVYAEAVRLKAFLSFFKEIDINEVPKNSILREFIGGSCFYEY